LNDAGRMLAGKRGDLDGMRTKLSTHVRLSLRYGVGERVGKQFSSKFICYIKELICMAGGGLVRSRFIAV